MNSHPDCANICKETENDILNKSAYSKSTIQFPIHQSKATDVALKTKAKFPRFLLILSVDIKGGQITLECFKGPNCKQVEIWISHYDFSPSQSVFDTGRAPTTVCNTNQQKAQQSGHKRQILQNSFCMKPCSIHFKAVWATKLYAFKKKRRKEMRAAGSVSQKRDYLYSTSPHYGFIKLGIVLLCVEGWFQSECDSGSLKYKQRSDVP